MIIIPKYYSTFITKKKNSTSYESTSISTTFIIYISCHVKLSFKSMN